MRKLKLKDAYIRLDQAARQEARLRLSFNDWYRTGGLKYTCARHPVYARYGFFVDPVSEPSENLGLLAGEIVNNLRAALDYIAFQIYLAGGGDKDAKQAKSVAFPIVTDAASWKTTVTATVPFAWEEAIEQLKWCQPFVQLPPNDTALPALRGIGATDKHRELVMQATAISSIAVEAPADLAEGGAVDAFMYTPGPEVVIGQPALLGDVYRSLNDGPPIEENMMKWGPGVELKEPPAPTVVFEFRANDESIIQIDAFPQLIAHVRHIVDRFNALKVPSQQPSQQQSAT